jgi:hypothetical protein
MFYSILFLCYSFSWAPFFLYLMCNEMHRQLWLIFSCLWRSLFCFIYRLNWRVTSTGVWLFIRKLCIIIGIMLMLCIISGLLMVRCLSLIWYVLHTHLCILLYFLHSAPAFIFYILRLRYSFIVVLIVTLENLFILLLRLLCSMNSPSISIHIVRKLVTI